MTEIKEKITVTELPIIALRSFEEHPYKVVDNEEMASLVESIYTQGDPQESRSLCRHKGGRAPRTYVFGASKVPRQVFP